MSYKTELKSKYYPQEYSLTPDFAGVTLKLELTNICNHRCITCPHSKQMRTQGFMDPALAKRLIREAAELHVDKIALFLNGESFLVPNIAEYVRYCKECGIKYVFLTTNGSRASHQQLAEVMEAGLDSLKFSLNASDPETYRLVHGSDDFGCALDNLRFARDYRDKQNLKCRLLAGCVLTDYTKHQLDQYCQRIGPLVDDLLFLKPDNFAGYMVRELEQVFHDDSFEDPRVYSFGDKRLPCPLLFNSANVTYEGYLTLCCSEALNYMVTEDLNQMSLLEAWNSSRMQDIRARHLRQEIAGTQCYNCMFNAVAPVIPANQELFEISSLSAKGDG